MPAHRSRFCSALTAWLCLLSPTLANAATFVQQVERHSELSDRDKRKTE
jgi:hypothetical protein